MMINFEGSDVRIDAIEEIKALKLPIFLWGGEVYSGYVAEYLRANHISDKIEIVVDDEYIKENDGFMPLSEYLLNWSENSIMIFGFYSYKIVQNKYRQYKDQIKYLYDFRITHVGDHLLEWDKNEAEKNLPSYIRTYEMLADDKSRLTMERYLRAAVNGEFEELFENCYEETAYFNAVTEHLPIDVLIDCGAFDGDDICDFVKVFPKYDTIYAIEPDQKNAEKLKNRMNGEGISDVIVITKGVYRESAVLRFSSGNGVASHLDDSGDVEVPVLALDELLQECPGNILIKMDIEGSEMDALAGASRAIAARQPCLAICVYHKEEDLIKIPQYIDSLVEPNTYDYYLRFHGLGLAELVFYAVPRLPG